MRVLIVSLLCGAGLVAVGGTPITAQARRVSSPAVSSGSALRCKDGTLVTNGTAKDCGNHGGVDMQLRPTLARQAPAGTVSARCKDGTTERDAPTACANHGGVTFRFLTPKASQEARRSAPHPVGNDSAQRKPAKTRRSPPSKGTPHP